MWGDDSNDGDEELAPRVGSPEWRRERRERKAEFDKEFDRMDRWFWRIFYAAVALAILSFIAIVALVVLLGMNFWEIVEFFSRIPAYQGVALMAAACPPLDHCRTCGEPLKFKPCLNDHTHLNQERDER